MSAEQHLTITVGSGEGTVSPRPQPQSPSTSPQHKNIKKDERALAEEEETSKGTWWGRFKDSLKPKPTTLKEIINSAGSSEATYRFDFMDFELDILSITSDEAQGVAHHQYCVYVERQSMTVAQTQHGQTKWAGPASAFAKSNTKLSEMRRQILDWENQPEEGSEVAAKLSPDEIAQQAEGSFFGVASSTAQGLEFVRCPTDFGTVKEAERYIVRHRWAPSFNVIPVVTNIKRTEQLEETDPFGDNADTSTPTAGVPALTRTNVSDLMAGSDEENDSPFANFQADPNAALASGAGSDVTKFAGYSNQHRRHTATYGGGAKGILSQAAAAHHHRTVSYGAGATSSPSGIGSAANDPIRPYITYNQTNQNCVGEFATPYVSTIGLNPCEALTPKHKANTSVAITIVERTDVDLSTLSKIGISNGTFGSNAQTLPGNQGRKFTTARLDLTKASMAAFGGQRYELYFFDESDEAKRERKKIKGKIGATGGMVPSLVLRFKVQGTLIDRETHEDVTAQSPARRRLLSAKISDAPAYPYAFVLDQFVLYRNTKPDYNVSAGLVKRIKGTGIAEVTIGTDGAIMDKKEKEKESKKAKEAEGEESDDAPDEEVVAEPQSPVGGAATNATFKHQSTLPTAVPRMQPLHLRNKFKLCDHDGPAATPTPPSATTATKDEAGAGALSTADEKTAILRGAGTHELKFEDLFDCYVVTPQFATMKNYTVGDVFSSNSEAFAAALAEEELPSGITAEDVSILMKRQLIKMQCKTPDGTSRIYTQCIPGRGSNLDFALGSSSSPATPASATADAKETATKAYNELLFYPNPSPVQVQTSISLAPYVNLNTVPVEGVPLSIAFPKKQSISLHHYEDEIMTFRLRRFLLPSAVRAGLAPQTQWEVSSETFDSDDCPYRVYEDVLSLESFFESLR